MLAELGHELMVGDAGKIRASETRKQKHDRRDAWHIMELMAAGKFPRIWLPSAKERDVRVLVEHRHQLVQMRTRAKNGLQAMALSYALRKRRQLWSVRGQEELQKIPLREGMGRRRFHPFNVYSEKKRLEKLNDMHNNPVKRGLLVHPGDWPWSSWRFYYRGDPLLLAMDR
jgi:transposase